MIVKELIKQLERTGKNNEVRIISETKEEYTNNLYLSFDDIGDVLIYEGEE